MSPACSKLHGKLRCRKADQRRVEKGRSRTTHLVDAVALAAPPRFLSIVVVHVPRS